MKALEHAKKHCDILDQRSAKILREILEEQWYRLEQDIIALYQSHQSGLQSDIDRMQQELNDMQDIIKRLVAREKLV